LFSLFYVKSKVTSFNWSDFWLIRIVLCSQKNSMGAYYCHCVRPFVFPSVRAHISYYLSSEINVVDNKCSFRLGVVDQGHSRSLWKVQGHSQHIIQKSNFNISSYNRQRLYWHEIFRNIYWITVTGNICWISTLDMAPKGQPHPPKMRNHWISQKLRSPPLNYLYILVTCGAGNICIQ
jgi:hypothetical protein